MSSRITTIVVVAVFVVGAVFLFSQKNDNTDDNLITPEQYQLKDIGEFLEIHDAINNRVVSSIQKEKLLTAVRNKVMAEQGYDPQEDSPGERYLLHSVLN